MKQLNAEQATPAFERGGEAGAMRVSGKENEISGAPTELLADDLRRRLIYPFPGTDEYQQAVAEPVAPPTAALQFGHGLALWAGGNENPKQAARVIMGLLVILSTLCVGCWVEHAATAAFAHHTHAIDPALLE